jgi:arsenate reductase (glutaredoxin)
MAVPAPLGKVPTKKMPQIQVFGRDDSPATRAALRFFRERRIVVHYVDLKKRDEGSKAFRESGLGYLSMGDSETAERLARDSRLIRLPLVRHGNDVTTGPAEATWVAWLSHAAGATASR